MFQVPRRTVALALFALPFVPATLSGFLIPAFLTRRVDTVVELKDGQSLVIGGLTNTDVRKERHKIPVLGDIPVFGVLFQNSRDTIDENELVVLVSPRIIRPLEASETPALPNPADAKE